MLAPMVSHFPELRPAGLCLAPRCAASLEARHAHALTCGPNCRKALSRAVKKARALPLGEAWAEMRALAWRLEVRDFWRTPEDVYRALSELYGPFDLDAAAAGPEDALAPRWLTPEDDALTADWVAAAAEPGRMPRIWNNPPYSRRAGGLVEWVRAAVRARNAGALVVQLVQAANATEWAKLAKVEAAYRLNPDHRIPFVSPNPDDKRSSNRGESMVYVYVPGKRGPAVSRDWSWLETLT